MEFKTNVISDNSDYCFVLASTECDLQLFPSAIESLKEDYINFHNGLFGKLNVSVFIDNTDAPDEHYVFSDVLNLSAKVNYFEYDKYNKLTINLSDESNKVICNMVFQPGVNVPKKLIKVNSTHTIIFRY